MYAKSHSKKMMQKSKYFILKKALFTYFPQKSKYFILKKALFFFLRVGREARRERGEKRRRRWVKRERFIFV